ncbi:PHP domain-containing protein, partial [bacterium CPR1]|nr:PHP domain-containing protein [bacterium CPR1]
MVHLHARSWFSFLAGASSPEALVVQARRHEQAALALTDLFGVYGLVRFAAACRKHEVQPIFGASLMVEGALLVLLVTDRQGYQQLCQLCSLVHGFTASELELPGERLAEAPELVPPGKQEPRSLRLEELAGRTASMLCLTGGPEGKLDRLLRQRQAHQAERWLSQLRELFPDRLYVELVNRLQPGDCEAAASLHRLAARLELPSLASNAVRYAEAGDYALYDALTCVRLGLSVGDPHRERPVNDSALLCHASELARRLPYPEALERTREVAWRCQMELLAEEITPPTALLPTGRKPDEYLRELCLQGWRRLYTRSAQSQRPGQAGGLARSEHPPSHAEDEASERSPGHAEGEAISPSEAARLQLERELEVVGALELEEFFLVVREVVDFARAQGIRCAGRGSAANSIIAYLLGITAVDPLAHNLLFERFLHRGRKGMPDIDVDFDSERREEVIAWMERRFGVEHSAMTANVITYRLKLAMRDMLKVLGYTPEQVDRAGRLVGHWDDLDDLRGRRGELAAVLGGEAPISVLFR